MTTTTHVPIIATPPVAEARILSLRNAWKHQQRIEDQAFQDGDEQAEHIASGAVQGMLGATMTLLGIPRGDAFAILEGEAEPTLSR